MFTVKPRFSGVVGGGAIVPGWNRGMIRIDGRFYPVGICGPMPQSRPAAPLPLSKSAKDGGYAAARAAERRKRRKP